MNLDEIIREINTVVAQVVGMEIDGEVPLMEAGLTSLSALKLGRALKSRLSTDLPATLVFDHPSLSSVTSLILSNELSEDITINTVLIEASFNKSVAICAMAFSLPVFIGT